MLPSGFTMVELLLSLAIMAMVILTLFSLAASSVRGTEKTGHLATGQAVAESQLEYAIRNAQADIPAGDKDRFWGGNFPRSGTPFVEGSVNISGTEFKYAIYATGFNHSATGLPVGGDVLLENRIKHVECLVWWMTENPEDSRQGFGKMTTSAMRLVNEEPDEI